MLLLNSDKKKKRTEISTEIMNKQAATDWEELVFWIALGAIL